MSGSKTTTSTNSSTTTADPRNQQRGNTIATGLTNYYMPGGQAPSYQKSDVNAPINDRYTGLGNQYDATNGSWSGNYGTAQDAATGAFQNNGATKINGPSYTTADVNQFMSPYTQNVLDAGLSQINKQQGQQKVSDDNAAAGAEAFGNSRRGVVDANRDSAFDMNKNSFIANTLQGAFTNAQNQLNTNYGQQLQANSQNNAASGQNFGQGMSFANFVSGLGNSDLQNQLAAANGNLNYTNTVQGLNQSAADRASAQNQYAQNYPLTIGQGLARINALTPGVTSSTGTGTQTTPTDYLGSGLYAAGSMLPMLMSDERVKEDVRDLDPEETLGAFSRIPTKSYAYKAEYAGPYKGRRDGFMAQDYERAFGETSPEVGGVKHVDIPQIIGRLVTAVKGLETRTRDLKKVA